MPTLSSAPPPPPQTQSLLLSLPAELRITIWEYALQFSAYEATSLLKDAQDYDTKLLLHLNVSSYYFFNGHAESLEHKRSPDLLRVCKMIYYEATSIFYRSMFIMQIYSGNTHTAEEMKFHRRLLRRLQRPRPINLRNLLLVVHASDSIYTGHSTPQDAPLIAGTANLLMQVCGVMDRVHVELVDWSFLKIFARHREVGIDLLRGLGMLQCHEPSCGMMPATTADDIEWSMKQPGQTMPLYFLFMDVDHLLVKYETVQARKQQLADEANQAVQERNRKSLLRIFDAVVLNAQKKLGDLDKSARTKAEEDVQCIKSHRNGDDLLKSFNKEFFNQGIRRRSIHYVLAIAKNWRSR